MGCMQKEHNCILKEICILNPRSHQSKNRFMNLVHILNNGRNIDISLIDNGIFENLLLNIFAVGKVSINIDFQENEVISLLHQHL